MLHTVTEGHPFVWGGQGWSLSEEMALKLRHVDENELDLRSSEGKWPGQNKQGQMFAKERVGYI